MVSIKESVPKSAKNWPCFIFVNSGYELAFLTDNEKYFVSIDHKRVYLVNEVDGWNMVFPTTKDLHQLFQIKK